MTTHDTTMNHLGRVRGKNRTPQELVALGGSTDRLTDEQVAIVSAPTDPSLVVAGAGSGKTETLSLRFVYLLDHAQVLFGRDLSPDEILCLTFTRKAAGEIADRVARRIERIFGPDTDRPPPAVSTYNAYAAGLVGEHGLRVGVDPESCVLTNASLWQMAARIAETWDGGLEFEGSLASTAAAIPSLSSSLADHGVTTGEFSDFLSHLVRTIEGLPLGPRDRKATKGAEMASPFRSRASLAALVDGFRTAKRQASSLDFSDQIALAIELTRLPAVQAAERARFQAVLLDEFQDTSPGQLDLFANLFGDGHSVMAVGDPLQAIYGFRGASESALERFIERFGIGSGRRMTLSVSWRNSSDVLRVANATTEDLRSSSMVQVPLLRSRSEETGGAEPPRVPPSVTAQVFPDLESEATGLVSLVVQRRAALEETRDFDDPVECAILCRIRRLFPVIVNALKEAGVDYQVVGLGGLLDTPIVVDLVALLQVAHDPSRGDSLMRLLTSERVALGVRDIAALAEWAEEAAGPREDRETEVSIVDAIEELPVSGWVSRDGRTLTNAARTRLDALRGTIDTIRRHAHLPLPEIVQFTARSWNLDIEARIPRRDGASVGDEAIHALVEAARGFSGGVEHATLGAFLSWLEAASEHEDGLDTPVQEPRKGAVQVLTIHAAKGMEWDLVAVPGLVDGVFPNVGVSGKADDPTYRSSGWLTGAGVLPWPLRRDRDRLPTWEWGRAGDLKELETLREEFREAAARHAIEEERRLFYVAITRARSDVVLTASPHPESRPPRPVSVFLRDLVNQDAITLEPWIPSDRGPEERQARRVSWPGAPTPSQEVQRRLAAEVLAAVAESLAPGEKGLPYAQEIGDLLAEAEKPRAAVLGPVHLSSTDLVRLSRDREAFALARRRPVPTEPTVVARRGDAFHAWVERYFRTPTLMDPDEPIGDPDEGASDGSDLGALQSRFLEGEWSRRLPEAVEIEVEVPMEGYVLRCRIDAVFPPGAGLDRITVVDWKTGRPPEDPKERASREVQLAVYRLAWATWKGLSIEEVDAAFVYVGSGETVRPDRLLGREGLLELIRGD